MTLWLYWSGNLKFLLIFIFLETTFNTFHSLGCKIISSCYWGKRGFLINDIYYKIKRIRSFNLLNNLEHEFLMAFLFFIFVNNKFKTFQIFIIKKFFYIVKYLFFYCFKIYFSNFFYWKIISFFDWIFLIIIKIKMID